MVRLIILFLGITLLSSNSRAQDETVQDTAINWLTWNEALTLQSLSSKKIFVMVGTDWSIPCSKMHATTFLDTAVVQILNNDFYPVLLDAESKDTIRYRDIDFVFKPEGDGGFHQLATSLLNGDMSFPSLIILSKTQERLNISRGVQNPKALFNTLNFFLHDGHLEATTMQFGAGYNFQCKNPKHRHGYTTADPNNRQNQEK